MQHLQEQETQLRKWYGNARPRHVDLIGDFGGSQLFVVEGDALLYRYLFDPETHWVDARDPTGGAQLLALAYHVENFLGGLLDRGCSFHLVFFDAHRSIWAGNAKLLVVRQAIIEHIRNNVDKITLKEFDGWWGDEWEEYLEGQQPLFALVGDGSTERDKLKIDYEGEDTVQRRMAFLSQGFMYSCIERDISIALLSGMEFRDSRALAFVFDRIGLKGNHEKFEKKLLAPLLEELVDNIDPFSLSDLLIGVKKQPIKTIQDQRMLLTVGFVATQLGRGVYHNRLLRSFLRHAILLDHIPLDIRAQKPLETKPALVVSLLDDFFNICWCYMADAQQWRNQIADLQLRCNLADLVDARFFATLWLDDQAINTLIPRDMQQTEGVLWQLAAKLARAQDGTMALDIENFGQDMENLPVGEHSPSDLTIMSIASPRPGLLPFSFPFFEKYLSDVRVSNLPAKTIRRTIDRGMYGIAGLDNHYQDIYHWHSVKLLADKKKFMDGKSPEYQRKLLLRNEQKYARHLERYATSLDNRHNISIQVDANPKKGKAKEVVTPKKSAKALAIIEQNMGKKQAEGWEKTNERMTKAVAEVEKIKGETDRLRRFSELLKAMEDMENATSLVLMRAHVYQVQLQVAVWAKVVDKADGKAVSDLDMAKAMDIYREVFYIRDRFSEHITAEVVKILEQVLHALGLPDSASKISELNPASSMAAPKPKNSQSKKPASTKAVSSSKAEYEAISFKWPRTKDLAVGLSDVQFQMRHGAHSMERNTDSKTDARVKSFKPDSWQVEVLDVIDQNESALVCCPTSSGKTFIAFYAMEKVLKADNDGIIVYVAPTKALVNQVLAEVYGRFKKIYPDTSGKSHWGVFTREYCENHETCQILVTVPEMLEILLLSADRSESWAPRIKRIIFDEIHSIGEAGRGAVWEHLLLLSQCPILALSATVGNPEDFSDWVAKAQKARGYRMRLIKTDKRYSELQKFAYIPEWPLQPFESVKSSPTDALVPIHPCSALSSVLLASKGFPSDMKVLPLECLNLYNRMCEASGPEDRSALEKLDPERWFRAKLPITKDDATKYEKQLKEVFERWGKVPAKRDSVQKVISDLGSQVKDRFQKLEAASGDFNVYDNQFLYDSIMNLGVELNAQDKLPAIFFLFDRRMCNTLALLIIKTLVRHEEKDRDNNEKYQQKKANAIRQEEERKKQAAKQADAANSKKGGHKGTKDDDEIRGEDDPAIFDWRKPDPKFTFVKENKQVTQSELREILSNIEDKLNESLKPLVEGLMRGIGVHHSGLPRSYRGAVEILFRRGHLRIVIATGSLAMGINMPCKTVVFLGDSIFLTALNYRQMSGRGGRRGFDPVGNVIFCGLTQTKINRLLISDLPKLTGHFPLTTTLVLRSFLLLTQSENLSYSEKAIEGLMGTSFFCLGREYLSSQIQHHLRFSIEYLMRENLLSECGELLNLSGAVSHLYYTEPSNFAFAVLYKHGVFHRICDAVDRNEDKVKSDLMLVLSHIFNRKPLQNLDRGWYRKRLEKWPSKIFLPELPADVASVLDAHNDRVLDIYTAYITLYASQSDTPDRSLPLSNLSPTTTPSATLAPLGDRLRCCSPRFAARSPFIAVASGQGDVFRDVNDLTMHLCRHIYLDAASIPLIKFGNVPLNAYLYDFFTHGQEIALVEANMIRPGEVWEYLQDFSLVLVTIVASLETMEGVDDNVKRGFQSLQTEFNTKFKKIWA